MEEALAVRESSLPAEILEKVLIGGDLSDLSVPQRVEYYAAVARSIGLNPLTKPFDYLALKERVGGETRTKLILYAKRDCTDQLRKIHHISIPRDLIRTETVEGIYTVFLTAMMPDGRTDTDVGAVAIVKEGGTWKTTADGHKFARDGTYVPLSPDDRANAMMKAMTKAKRRATLSICGLGMLDESEIETIAQAQSVDTTFTPAPALSSHTQSTRSGSGAPITPLPVSEQPPTDRPTILGQCTAMLVTLKPADLQKGDGTEVKWRADILQETFGYSRWQEVQAKAKMSILAEGWKRLKAKVAALHVAAEEPADENDVPLGDTPDSPSMNENAPAMASRDGIAEVRQLAAGIGASLLLATWGPEVTLAAYTELFDYLQEVSSLRDMATVISGTTRAEIDGTLGQWHGQGQQAPADTRETLKGNLQARLKAGKTAKSTKANICE